MAITENSFTGEELSAAVKANPGLIDHVKGFLTQEQRMIVRTTDEETNHLKKYEEEKIGERVSQIAKGIETDVESLTGIKKKDANEKYYDYVKRVIGELNTGRQELERQIADLKGKTNLSDAERQRLKSLEDALAEKETSITTLKEEKDKEIFNLKISGQLDTALAAIRATYKKELPPSLIAIAEEQAKKKLLAMAKIQDDNTLTFIDKDGKVMTDAKNAYKPKTASQLFQETDELKDIIDTGRQQAGAGSGPAAGSGKDKIGNDKYTWAGVPAEVKTRVELTRHLKTHGILDGSEEYNKIFEDETVSKLPLR